MNLDLLTQAIGRIHTTAQSRAGLAINQVLNWRNWLIGAYIETQIPHVFMNSH